MKWRKLIEYTFPNGQGNFWELQDYDSGLAFNYWDETLAGGPQPTIQSLIDTSNTQEYLDWYEEHGGNTIKTLRREAKEAISRQKSEDIKFRAALIEIIKEFNRHADKHNELLDAIDAATSLPDLQIRVGAINNYPQRTALQLRTLIETAIDNEEADT